MDCIFCKLANKEIPTDVVYEDEAVFAFKDGSPQAPSHLLFIPKAHIASVNEVEDGDHIISKIFQAIKKVAHEQAFADDGYRVVTNIGQDGGQSVFHLHFHVMGGPRPWLRG